MYDDDGGGGGGMQDDHDDDGMILRIVEESSQVKNTSEDQARPDHRKKYTSGLTVCILC